MQREHKLLVYEILAHKFAKKTSITFGSEQLKAYAYVWICEHCLKLITPEKLQQHAPLRHSLRHKSITHEFIDSVPGYGYYGDHVTIMEKCKSTYILRLLHIAPRSQN